MGTRFWKKYWGIIKETFVQFQEENAIAHSASIAFYTIFSLPGILIIVIRVAGIAFGEDLVRGNLQTQVTNLIGEEAAIQMVGIMENAQISEASPLMTFVGILVLLFSATTVFTIIQGALNHIWRVKPKPKKGWLKLIRDRLLSFGMVVTLGFLMLISLLLDWFVVIFKDLITEMLPGNYSFVVPVATALLSLVIVSLIFAMIFKILPDAIIKWKDVTVGAFVTTLLFTLGKYLIGIYLRNSDFGNTYGAAGSTILILIWVNYSAMIMLLGAKFTQVYTQFSGRRIKPSSNAVKVSLQEIETEE